jgi:hypothetical protein
MTHDLDEDTDLAFERAEARADQAADREYHDSLRRNVFGAALVVVPMEWPDGFSWAANTKT